MSSRQIPSISMLNLLNLIKTAGNNDTLTLYIEKDDVNRLGIRIENSDKNSITNFKLNLMDLPEESMSTFHSI